MKKERIKELINLAPTAEDADNVLSNQAGLKNVPEKIAVLKELYNEVEVEKTDEELYYILWLRAIIRGECSPI